MKLLIDLGNTRLKWALWNGVDLELTGAVPHAAIDALPWSELPPVDDVWVASVAAADLNARVEQSARRHLGGPVHFVRSRAQACGVRNAYVQPERLGIDRFLALIAAHAQMPAATVIASCGTALTLDAINTDGEHFGGLIAASPELGLAALRSGTAQLGAAPLGRTVEIADNTADAMESGSWLAAAALIERFVAGMTARMNAAPRLLLTGGGASRLGELIAPPARIEPDLVLRGLAHLADAGG